MRVDFPAAPLGRIAVQCLMATPPHATHAASRRPPISVDIPEQRMPSIHTSTIPYDASRMHAAAMYCSDGRVGEHFDDFLQNGRNLPRDDRLCLPGGPACIAGHQEAHLEEQGVMDELKFLVEVHGLKRVVLIQHQSCAFYGSRLGLKEPRLELVQRADLVRAAAFVHRVTGVDRIEAYFASIQGGKVEFEVVRV